MNPSFVARTGRAVGSAGTSCLLASAIVVASASASAAPAGAAHTGAPAMPPTLPIEVELRQLCDTVLQGIERLPDPGRPRLVTVVPFGGGDDQATRDVRRLLSDYLDVVCLSRARRIVVADPKQAGLLDSDGADAPATRAALAGIDVVLTGRVTRGPTAYTTTAQLHDTTVAEALSTVLHPLPLAAMDAFVVETMRPRTPAGAVLRAAVLPGWGQFYNQEPTKGVLVLSTEVAVLGAAIGFYAAHLDARRAYDVPVPERVSAREDAEQYGNWALIAAGVAGAVWVGSIVDAWLSGHRYVPRRAFGTTSGSVSGASSPGTGTGWTVRW